MFSSSTIEKIRELDLLDVIGKYVKLKKSGANYVGLSPFTEEKSPSFSVSTTKNIWHCFSTGKGGNNPIKFVMELKGLSFKEAINLLASDFNVPIEMDDEKGTKYLEDAKEKMDLEEVNKLAMEFFHQKLVQYSGGAIKYQEHLPQEVLAQAERAGLNQIERFSIGYAGNDYDEMKQCLLKKGVSIDLMHRSGLVKKRETESGVKWNDVFRNRIIFPIFSESGKVIGFSGRAVSWEKGDKFPKVLNTAESKVYSKSKSMLGLSLAREEARNIGEIVKVEGNFDVTALHEKGVIWSVATLGSALTDDHAAKIKRFAPVITLAVDNDKAGLSKLEKDTITCLKAGLMVKIWVPENEGEDPFDYCSRVKQKGKAFIDQFNEQKIDAIEYLAQMFFQNAEDVVSKSNAQNKLATLLSIIPDATLRNNYVKHFCKQYDLTRKDVEEKVSVELAAVKAKDMDRASEDGFKLPPGTTKEQASEFMEWRFYSDTKPNTCGYYFPTEGRFERVSNCVLKPIFQVRGNDDSKRIVELISSHNSKPVTMILALPNAAFVSQTEMEKALSNEGGFWFHGSKRNYQTLKAKLFTQFAQCDEIMTLGWQRAGFFAFANGIVDNGSFKPINNFGICVHGNENYFLPACSSVYDKISSENDPFENERQFLFRPSSVTFKQWSNLFYSAYKDNNNGMFGIAFVLAAFFSDHIYRCNNSAFPMLYGFGQPRTGKSTMGRSISKIYKKDPTEFNLNQGTPIAISRRLSRTRNTVEHLDEYQNDLDEKRFQTLKGIYDRTGHEKGVLSNDNKTTTTKINAATYISGQYFPSRDGNSLVTRMVILNFEKKQDQFTEKEIGVFNKLTEIENAGLSNVILEVIKYRSLIEDQYSDMQFQIGSKLRDELRELEPDGRVMQNYTVLCAVVKLLEHQLSLPFTYEQFYEASKQAILRQSAIIAESDQLAEFFKMLQFLIADSKIYEGEDFKLEETHRLTLRNGSKGTETIVFDAPKKILHLNFARIYPLYLKETRNQKGENGIPDTTLKSYMKTHKSFVGTPPAMRFGKMMTSAWSFEIDKLPVSLDIMNSRDEAHISSSTQSQEATGNYHTPGITNAVQQTLGDNDLPF